MVHTLKLALRSLLARPLRTVLTAFAILLGVSVILAIDVANLSTLDSITDLFDEASGKAQLIVLSSDLEGGGFSQSVLRRVSNAPGVAVAAPSVRTQTLLSKDASGSGITLGFYTASMTGLLLYGIDPAVDTAAREYRLVAGHFFAPGSGKYDVVLVEDFANKKKLKVGSNIDVVTPDGAEQLRLIGLISKDGPGRLNNGDFGVIPLRVAQDIFGRGGELDQIDVVTAPGSQSTEAVDALKAQLQAELGDKYSVTYPATQGRRVTQMIDTYQFGLSFFSAIALFVGAFLIYNAFSMNLSERTREIGLLRAVGMTRGQVMRQILTEAAILGLIGSALGVAAGFGLAKGLIRVMELLLSQDMQIVRVPVESIVRSVTVGVGTTLLAAAIPARQAGRVSPLEALRARARLRDPAWVRWGWPFGVALMAAAYIVVYFVPMTPARRFQLGQVTVIALFLGATLVIPATVAAWETLSRPAFRLLYGREGMLGSANIKRSRSRTTLTAAALMVGVSMILGIRGLTGSFATDIKKWVDSYVGGDLYVYSSVPIRSDMTGKLQAVEGVEAMTPVRYLDGQVTNPQGARESVTLMFFDPATHDQVGRFTFVDQSIPPEQLMQEVNQGDAVFISSVIAEKYGLERGSTLEVNTRREARPFKVAAVVVDFYNRGMVVEASWRDMRRYFGTEEANLYFVKVKPGQDPAVVRDAINALYGKRRHLTVDSNVALRARALTLADRGMRMFDVLAVIAVIVGSFGVVNTLTMNITERTRELGALRGLGMTRWQMSKMILAEAGVMGLIGGVFGLAFGLFLSRVFLDAVTAMRDYNITYVLPTQGIILSLVLSALISQIAAILPARRAAGLRIVDAIQYE